MNYLGIIKVFIAILKSFYFHKAVKVVENIVVLDHLQSTTNVIFHKLLWGSKYIYYHKNNLWKSVDVIVNITQKPK